MSSSTDNPKPVTLEEDGGLFVGLTHAPLDLNITVNRVRNSKAGAIVAFAGTTRDNFDSAPVQHLSYSSYVPKCLSTLATIARETKAKHGLIAIAIIHRLGEVGIGEESVHIVVSAPHRTAAWRAGEEALEDVKARAEIWKKEVFEDGGVWRANRDGQKGQQVIAGDGESVSENTQNVMHVGREGTFGR